MFRKQLLRQSRAISQSISRSTAAAPKAHFSYTSSASSVRPSLAYAQQIPQRRWQSTEADKKDDKPAEGQAKADEAPAEDAAKKELEQKNKEIIDLKDKYLRSVADYRNLQERTKRDMDAAKQFAIQRFATDLLDSIDNLDRALTSVPKEAVGEASTTSNTSSADPNKAAASESVPPPNKDLLNLYSGLKMTSEILLNILKKHGLERYDPLEREGQKFNPQTDEATFFTKVEGKEDGTVFYTQSKGFTLNGRVVRAAKVGVVKNA